MAKHTVVSAQKHKITGSKEDHVVSTMDENELTFRHQGSTQTHRLNHGQAARYAAALDVVSGPQRTKARDAEPSERRRRRPRRKAD